MNIEHKKAKCKGAKKSPGAYLIVIILFFTDDKNPIWAVLEI